MGSSVQKKAPVCAGAGPGRFRRFREGSGRFQQVLAQVPAKVAGRFPEVPEGSGVFWWRRGGPVPFREVPEGMLVAFLLPN